MELIPIIILEKVINGHELLDDEYQDLSCLKNIGSANIVSVIQKTRGAFMAMGMVITALGFLAAGSGNITLAEGLVHGGLTISAGGAASMLYPSGARKPLVKFRSSMKRYKNIFSELKQYAEQLKDTPAGLIKLALANAIIKNTYEPGLEENLSQLKSFVARLEDPQCERDFNDMFAGSEISDGINESISLIEIYKNTREEVKNLTQ